MISLNYGQMPSFDEFVNHLKKYTDEDGYLVAGEPPEVFMMEVHPSCDDYEAFFNLYNAFTASNQDQVDTILSPLDSEWIRVTFTSHKSLYDFLSLSSQQWDYEPAMELAYMIMETIGYHWE